MDSQNKEDPKFGAEGGTGFGIAATKKTESIRNNNIPLNQDEEISKYQDKLLNDKLSSLDSVGADILESLLNKYFKPNSRESIPGFPPVDSGFVRLFRGETDRQEYNENHERNSDQGKWWSQYLDTIAGYAGLNNADTRPSGHLYYVDVPEQIAQRAAIFRVTRNTIRASIHEWEFYLPRRFFDGRKAISQEVSEETLNDVARRGEYTKELVNQDQETNIIRDELIRLAFKDLCSFWYYQKYQDDPRFRETQRAGGSPAPELPRNVANIEAAENLLAKISGWR